MKLTQADVETYDAVYGGHIFLLNPATDEIGPHPFYAKACVECRPFCGHGEDLTAHEIAFAKESGKRLSATCPVCVCSTDPDEWNLFLRRIGFSEYRGMSPAVGYVPTSQGGVHAIGQKKNFVRAGGAKQMEHADAQSKTGRSDMDAKSTRRKGHGSDSYDDEQVRVNESGDAVSWVPSTFVDGAEQIRNESTKEIIAAQLDDEEFEHAAKEGEPEHVHEDVRPDKPEPDFNGTKPKVSKGDKRLLKDIQRDIADDLKEHFDDDYDAKPND